MDKIYPITFIENVIDRETNDNLYQYIDNKIKENKEDHSAEHLKLNQVYAVCPDVINVVRRSSVNRFKLTKVCDFIKKNNYPCIVIVPFNIEIDGGQLGHVKYAQAIKISTDRYVLQLNGFERWNNVGVIVKCDSYFNPYNPSSLSVEGSIILQYIQLA